MEQGNGGTVSKLKLSLEELWHSVTTILKFGGTAAHSQSDSKVCWNSSRVSQYRNMCDSYTLS